MEFKQKAVIHNRFDVEVRDAKTNELKQTAVAYNIILNRWFHYFTKTGGVDYYADPLKAIGVGKGTGTLSVTRTDVFSYLGRKIPTTTETVYAYPTSYITKEIRLEADEYNGNNITEVGFLAAYYDTYYHFVTHAFLQDSEGNQIAIQKTDTDVVIIRGTFYVTFNCTGFGDNGIYPPANQNGVVKWLLGTGSFPATFAFSRYNLQKSTDLSTNKHGAKSTNMDACTRNATTWRIDYPVITWLDTERLNQKHGDWEYAGVYADEAMTGTKECRDEFQRLLADCRAGRIDLILTKSISRFARNTVTLLETVRELKLLDVDIFFEEQNIRTMSAEGELMLTILASYAQEESLSASENRKWRIKRNFEAGKPWDCTILGYRAKDGVFEIVPEEAETVRLVFKWYLEGLGRQAIANRLNENGVPTRFEKTWHQDTIFKMLRNEKYAGDLLLQKTFRTDHLSKRKQVNQGELPMYHVQDAHEPIIDRVTFDAVQRELARRAESIQVKPGLATVFTGKIRCGICGKNYRRKTTHTGIAWVCATYNTKGKKYCASKQIPEEILKVVTAEVLGCNCFDENVFVESIAFMTALPNNTLEFTFTDSHSEKATWKDRSRSESWTEEMRQAAAEKTRKRSEKKCQEQ